MHTIQIDIMNFVCNLMQNTVIITYEIHDKKTFSRLGRTEISSLGEAAGSCQLKKEF